MGLIGFNLASEESALPTAPGAWFTVTCVFALVGFVLLTLCFLGSKENITTTPEKPVSFGDMWREFKANKCLQLVLGIFVVVFLASFISAPVHAYYTELGKYSATAQNAILVFTTIIPAALLVLVAYLIKKYPLTDEKLDEMSRLACQMLRDFPSDPQRAQQVVEPFAQARTPDGRIIGSQR